MVKTVSLNGEWTVSYGNVKDRPVTVPGAIEAVMEDRTFPGPFHYRTAFVLDEVDERASYVLRFDGISYVGEVMVNGISLATHEGIWDAFRVDATRAVRKGRNELEVRVVKPDFDESSPYFFRSVLFGFIPDVMLPFGGIWKDVALEILGPVYFERAVFRFDGESGAVVLDSRLNRADADFRLELTVTDPDGRVHAFECPGSGKAAAVLPSVRFWSPSSPALYATEAKLIAGSRVSDVRRIRGGFRRIEVRADGEVLLNGEPFYMRGALHWGCYPDRMVPLPTPDEVRDELEKLKAAGFNAVKHCLYFPPEWYYDLCDETGMVTWQELPLWLPRDNGFLLDRIYDQYPKMLDLFMHHPSVSFVSLGCELDATIGESVLNDLYRMVKERDPGMIVCDNSGSGECYGGALNARSDIYDYHFYAEPYYLGELIHEFTSSRRQTRPWLFGEYNDADTFRILYDRPPVGADWWLDPDETKNLLRLVHKGFNSDQPVYRQKEILERYGVLDEVAGLPELSKKQAHETRKFMLELTRSHNEIKGYNVTVIRDVAITSSGIFDEHMQPKAEFSSLRRINGDIVVSLHKNLGRAWVNGGDRFLHEDPFNHWAGETLRGQLVLSNRTHRPLTGTVDVSLHDGDRVLYHRQDEFRAPADRVGELVPLSVPLPGTDEARRLELQVRLRHEDGEYTNGWDIWVYPAAAKRHRLHLLDYGGSFRGIEDRHEIRRLRGHDDLAGLREGDLLLTTAYDPAVERAAARGVRVLAVVKDQGYFPLSWGPFFRECVKAILPHPVSDRLAHPGYAGLQFFGIGTDRYFDKAELERKIGSYTPIIRRYDARNFSVGDYLIEFRPGAGRVYATTLNFDGGQGSQPNDFSRNPLAVWLLETILSDLAQGA